MDGAIHRAAGEALLDECRKLNGCATGDAKITHGYHLPARYVIHTVGPVWRGGEEGEPQLLALCYRRALELVREHALRSVAFPSISTGSYGYPIRPAAEVAIQSVRAAIQNTADIEAVIFCCHSDSDLQIYTELLEGLSSL